MEEVSVKKFLFSIAVLFLGLFFNNVYAYTDGFEYMIQSMNIPKTNINGLRINEEVYKKYNLLVYGSPTEIRSNSQRFKSTVTGKWTLNGGAWNGSGTRGEYWILGEDYSGRKIHNEIFPDDYNSGTSPENWAYRIIRDAEESWNDATKYTFDIQKEYMLNHKLSRFGIEYNVTPLSIGLNKARLESCATWKSAGNVYTEKPGDGNIYWVATFSVPPMALNAKLNSVLELPNGNEYTISKDDEFIEIPINYGAFVDGLSEYTKKEHISNIEAELLINGQAEDVVRGSEQLEIKGTNTLVINKNNYPAQTQITLELTCASLMKTCFEKDPVMYDDVSQTIVVNIETEEKNKVPIINDIEAPIIYYTKLKRISVDSKNKDDTVDLYTVKKTGVDFICAGQVLYIEVKTSPGATKVYYDFSGKESIRTLDETTKNFEWYEPKSRNEKINYRTLEELEESYDFPIRLYLEEETDNYKIFSGTYLIPYETTQTLHSWNSLRKLSKDAFKIDERKLFTKKENPYRLVIRASAGRLVRTKSYGLDVAERWDELYNRDIYKYVSK